MYEWQRQIQMVVDEIDNCIKNHDDEALTLCALAKRLGYSEFHTTRKFKEISGMRLKDYLRYRKMAFALKEVRDSDRDMIEIACDYGFSSHEAFTRAFKTMYGIAPSVYRKHPSPVVHTNFCTSRIMRAMGIGTSGRSKISYPDRTARPSAACLTASRENWMMRAAVRQTAAAARLWHISMTRRAGSVTGAFRAQNAMGCASRRITTERCRSRCV